MNGAFKTEGWLGRGQVFPMALPASVIRRVADGQAHHVVAVKRRWRRAVRYYVDGKRVRP